MVCLCHDVNERRVCDEIARGACSREQITAACGAGETCQGCHASLDRLLVAQTPVSASAA